MGQPRAKAVLITRPREDAEALACALAARGISALIEPLMAVEFIDGGPLDLTGVQAIAATSANGVRALAARDHRRALPLLAVGDATARAARAAGFVSVENATGDVEALAGLIIRRLDPARGAVLHVAGTVVAGDLAGRLGRAGFTCRREILYRMRTADRLSDNGRRALADGSLTGVVLYSPRTAATFAELIRRAELSASCRPLAALCLSAAVAARVAVLPWRRVVIASRPEQDAMIEAIVADARPG